MHTYFQVLHLDWHTALAPGFQPDRTFDLVIGSDLIYYQSDAAALAATIAAHTKRSGIHIFVYIC